MPARFAIPPATRVTRNTCALIAGLSIVALPLAAQTGGMPPPRPQSTPHTTAHPSADSAQALVNLITTINRDEIAAGKFALAKSNNANVRLLAQHIVADHTRAMQEFAAKAPSASLTIPDVIPNAPPTKDDSTKALMNGMSEVHDTTTAMRGGMRASAIHSANVSAMADMQKANGAAFDKLYLDAQVKGHKAVIAALNANRTQNAILQPMVIRFRADVENHLSEARRMVGSIRP